ncbi:tyrosine-type recombinase/integrase [Psychrobacillus sp.]|uniref:tyrosine-type recombinase/integrase n=1 Tax=Psychrobacillus sp. TaxID=1871623 RepID=UPI0028BEF4A7|nr:tyrosine-type recombinase/integrase [Psychrobacillus sp.]
MASFRKMGDVWQYRVRYKDIYSEEWKEVSKSGYKTKKEAQIAAREREIEVMNGFEQGEINFAIYMNAWLNQYVKDKLKPNTFKSYRISLKNHAIPYFGNMELKDVKPMMYQKFIDSKLEEGLSTETTRRIHNVIYQAYKRAVLNGYVQKNPCENVSIKRREVKKLKFLEPKLIPPLLKALYKRGQIYGLFFKLLFDTGLRKGEAAALQWSDINWKDSTITIENSLNFQPEEDEEILGDTKNFNSKRTIEIRKSLLNELHTHLKYQNERKLALEDLYNHELNLVLCRDDGSPLPKSTLYNAFKDCLEKIGHPTSLPIHSTRHTHAVLLLEAGADMKFVQERLGHGSMQITSDVYAHVSKKMTARSIEKFDQYMKGIE